MKEEEAEAAIFYKKCINDNNKNNKTNKLIKYGQSIINKMQKQLPITLMILITAIMITLTTIIIIIIIAIITYIRINPFTILLQEIAVIVIKPIVRNYRVHYLEAKKIWIRISNKNKIISKGFPVALK